MRIVEDSYVDEFLPVGWKPYYIYHIFVNNKQVGNIILRLGSIQERYFDGHIGYSIDVPYRGHYYAYQAVVQLLPIAKEKGFNEIVITCNPDNIASRKTIQKLGAKYIETKKIPKEVKKYFTKEEVEKEIYIIKI